MRRRCVQLPHATVSCVECVSVGLMFERVLLALFGPDTSSLLPRSPSLSDFVRIYRHQAPLAPANQTRYIVSTLFLLLWQLVFVFSWWNSDVEQMGMGCLWDNCQN